MLIWFLPLFLAILMIGTPVVFALLFAPGFMVWVTGNEKDLAILYRNVYNGIDSFPLMALPFFMLAGEVMNRGGITTRLVEFSQAFMGHMRGGLAQVNILSSILFAGLSGSAVADTSALGSTLIPAMEKNGYTRKFAAAITAASSVIGPIIPPSGIMIIYAYVMGESVAALFMAGIIPGILVGIGLMVMVRLMADRYDLPKAERIVHKNQTIAPIEHWLSLILVRINFMGLLWAVFRLGSSFAGVAKPQGWMLVGTLAVLLVFAHFFFVWLRTVVSPDFRIVCKKGVVPLQTPIIILGGILVGVMTPTEASTVAVAYALLVSVFVLRSLTWADFFDVLQRSALASASVLLLVGAAVAFKTIVATSGAATTMADIILGLSENPLILLFLINILLFIVGMFLDAGPAIIILGPILGPIFVDIGVHPVHFAIIMSVNLTVGLATPPMGLVLFVASTVSREKVETIAWAILPFLAVEVVVIFLITFIPQISMTVPYLADFLGCSPDIGYMACISPGPPPNERPTPNQLHKSGRITQMKTYLARPLAMAATIAAYTIAATPVFADGHSITLRATANSNENDEDYDGLIVFKDYVEAASNGAITVELFIGTQLCSTGAECLEGVAEGSIDIYISTSGGAAGIFPYIQVLDLPYLMSSDRVAEAVLSSDFVRTLRDQALADSEDTIRLMTIGNTGGWRNFANTERRIQTPADMDGLKLRSVVADLPVQLVEAMGASATPIPWPELFTSLQTGVVQGTANGITDIMGMKFPDAGLQYLTLDGHSYMGALWWMNNERFTSMDEAQRRVIVDGFYALQQATFAAPKRNSIQAYTDFVDGGGEVYVPTPEEKAMFAQAAEPVQAWFRENVDGGSDMLDALLAAVAEVEADLAADYAADLN